MPDCRAVLAVLFSLMEFVSVPKRAGNTKLLLCLQCDNQNFAAHLINLGCLLRSVQSIGSAFLTHRLSLQAVRRRTLRR